MDEASTIKVEYWLYTDRTRPQISNKVQGVVPPVASGLEWPASLRLCSTRRRTGRRGRSLRYPGRRAVANLPKA